MPDLDVAGVLCDMDGTLVDSNALVDVMWNEFADAHGLDAAEVRHFAHGRPSRATIARYVDDSDGRAHWQERIHEMEATRFDGVVEIPGARSFTRALPHGRWALVTSAMHAPARARLQAVGIEAPSIVIGADDVEHGKPHPEGFSRAARELGVDPRDCVVFEDTDAGIEAGRAAGCTVVVVGGNDSALTRALPRVADMRQVRVRVRGARIGLSLPG
ncbi:HAD-IA family hydrolase [Demequina activiva]|uniref:Hydrolase n=1 Tax=Demequina activiva TaxID=1582364 RepID=A0A919Q628_9MICO|nr:HAD-IA family hydrolase [Demequina activiva]GIG55566.1 hydrolase [Demequina activiva]